MSEDETPIEGDDFVLRSPSRLSARVLWLVSMLAAGPKERVGCTVDDQFNQAGIRGMHMVSAAIA